MLFLHDPSAQLVLPFISVIAIIFFPPLTKGCPDQCICDSHLAVQCIGKDLTDFPSSFPLATRQLIISNNYIRELPALQLNYLSDLVYLDCSNNSLSEITESTFGNLQKLAYLDLSFNAFTQIDDGMFGPLAGLIILRMTDNPSLSEIYPNAFVENMVLQVLDVSRNNLTVLNISTLIALPALRILGLSGNPWLCNCDTEDLCLWMQIEGSRFQDAERTICQGPPDMTGQRLGDVGMQLRTECHQSLGQWDLLFFAAIGFIIFSAGTVSAWVMGALTILYENYSKKRRQEEEEDEE
ncbi:leucine-rich repeat-containing protein 52-like [Megalops cyprinoides]|uniref:leucine-rich repeat-containing protein 52-like n=1 Tax=Megalops cyprinoides TaxID=118141 RepID=UPI00186491D4|nr:leucine-rich repeat-containing protein 52-like [Megalops cyprinoides]